MDGQKIISRERRRGASYNTIYAPCVKLYNAILAFMNKDYYGFTGWAGDKWLPMHANSDKNPFPKMDFFGRKCRSTFGWKQMFLHAWSSPNDLSPHFYFMVNSPRTPHALICFDIDGEEHEISAALAQRIRDEVLCGMPTFLEPSRNRGGCYLWMIVERDSSPAEFNGLCNRLTVLLRRRYHDLGDVGKRTFQERRNERVHFFDGIKATLHYDDRPSFEKVWAEYDGNPNDNHRGLLATMPCSGFMNDPEVHAYAGRMRSFLRFVERKKGRYVNAVPESRLRDLLATLRPHKEVVHDPHATVCPPASASPLIYELVPYHLDSAKKKKGGRRREEARQKTLDRAKGMANPQGRMRFASGLCVECGYNLTGNVSGVCPECGKFLQNVQSSETARQSELRRRS